MISYRLYIFSRRNFNCLTNHEISTVSKVTKNRRIRTKNMHVFCGNFMTKNFASLL